MRNEINTTNKLLGAQLFFCALPPASAKYETTLIDALPRFRQDKATRFHFVEDRILSAAAWHLLRFAVRKICDVEASDIPVCYGEKGKPFFLGNHEKLHFNLSHCKTAVLCALSISPIGTDIESLRRCDLAIAKRFMPWCFDALLKHLDMDENGLADELFTKEWTKAESIFKSGRPAEGADYSDILITTNNTSSDLPDYRFYTCKISGYFASVYTTEQPIVTEVGFENLIQFVKD